jgi:hypothetical protein
MVIKCYVGTLILKNNLGVCLIHKENNFLGMIYSSLYGSCIVNITADMITSQFHNKICLKFNFSKIPCKVLPTIYGHVSNLVKLTFRSIVLID